MDFVKIAGIAFLIAGALGLIYGGFSYTQETHDVSVGPLTLSVQDKRWFNVPVWAGVVGIAIGGGLLFFGGSRK